MDGPISIPLPPESRLSLSMPPGLCALEPAIHDYDGQFFRIFKSLFEAENRLLLSAMDCATLQRARDGAEVSPETWIHVLAPLNEGEFKPFGAQSRDEALNELAYMFSDQGQLIMGGTTRDYNARFREKLSGAAQSLRIEKPRHLGLLRADDDAFYSAFLTDEVVGDSQHRIAGVIGWTYASGFVITVNAYTRFDNIQSFVDLLALDRAVVGSMIEGKPVKLEGELVVESNLTEDQIASRYGPRHSEVLLSLLAKVIAGILIGAGVAWVLWSVFRNLRARAGS